jgi:hypothetical protein
MGTSRRSWKFSGSNWLTQRPAIERWREGKLPRILVGVHCSGQLGEMQAISELAR